MEKTPVMKARFRKLVAANRWLKAVPNSLTLCNSLCGFAAILLTLNAYESPGAASVFAASAWVVLFAMVFDALDGAAARIFNAASMYGLQMDSLADMVTFGVAPATIMAVMTHSLRGNVTFCQMLIIYILCSIYMGGAALRLAKYNVHAILEHKSSDKFAGLPSPGAAAAVCSVVLLAADDRWDLSRVVMVLPVYAALLGLLMVSNVPYVHVGRWLGSVQRNRMRLMMLFVMLAVIGFFRIPGICVLITLYIFSGPVGGIIARLRRPGAKED